MIRYIVEVGEEIEVSAVQALLDHEIGPEAKDTAMTIAERLIEQGRQQGIEQGRQQGSQGVLLRLLRRRFGAAMNVEAQERIGNASSEQIDAWSERVLSAATLDEVFAG